MTVTDLINDLLDKVAEPDKARIWIEGPWRYYDINSVEKIDDKDPQTYALMHDPGIIIENLLKPERE